MTTLNVYSLTEQEIQTISQLNESRQNVLLIVCSFPGDVTGVILEDLQSEEFEPYLTALGGEIDLEKVVEVEISEDGPF